MKRLMRGCLVAGVLVVGGAACSSDAGEGATSGRPSVAVRASVAELLNDGVSDYGPLRNKTFTNYVDVNYVGALGADYLYAARNSDGAACAIVAQANGQGEVGMCLAMDKFEGSYVSGVGSATGGQGVEVVLLSDELVKSGALPADIADQSLTEIAPYFYAGPGELKD